jgi:hypothetical protein
MNVGGIYTDPFHSPATASANIFGLESPWYGGLRILCRHEEAPEKFLCIGCDDGFHFWVLTGEFTDLATGAVSMDFTPKAPDVGLLQCSYVPGALSFLGNDGKGENTWSRLVPGNDFDLAVQTKHDAFNNVNGLYVDPSIYKPGSFAGLRVVSDRFGKTVRDEICVVGTDNGHEWWVLEGGRFTSKESGKFTVGQLSGKCHNGEIKFEDGKEWVKMAPKTDFHALAKEV